MDRKIVFYEFVVCELSKLLTHSDTQNLFDTSSHFNNCKKMYRHLILNVKYSSYFIRDVEFNEKVLSRINYPYQQLSLTFGGDLSNELNDELKIPVNKVKFIEIYTFPTAFLEKLGNCYEVDLHECYLMV